MEKGGRANHATSPNDTSWSSHHSFQLKVKSTKSLPVISSLRGRVKSLGAFGSEDRKHIMDPTSTLIIPTTISLSLRFLPMEDFPLISKATWTNVCTFFLTDSKVQIFEAGQ